MDVKVGPGGQDVNRAKSVIVLPLTPIFQEVPGKYPYQIFFSSSSASLPLFLVTHDSQCESCTQTQPQMPHHSMFRLDNLDVFPARLLSQIQGVYVYFSI